MALAKAANSLSSVLLHVQHLAAFDSELGQASRVLVIATGHAAAGTQHVKCITSIQVLSAQQDYARHSTG